MIVLDTDHLSVFMDERDPRHERLVHRMDASHDDIVCTIVSIEEILRGWLSVIHRLRDVHRQVSAYSRLERLFDVFANWRILPFDKPAADQFALRPPPAPSHGRDGLEDRQHRTG